MNTIAPPGKKLLNMQEASEYLGAYFSTLQDNWKKWGIPGYKVGRNIMFRESELEDWLQSRRQ